MSAMTRRSLTASNILAPTQNTAPVLEYRCLYTSDIRRKQKRWQDGRLKFHTFNKRIMVFDDRGNAVGDTHWTQEYNFDEGEELELERSGKLVQVTEYEGRRDQDLAGLFEKRLKEREERVAAKASESFQALARTSDPLSKLMRSPVDRMLTQANSSAEQLHQRLPKRRKLSDFPCKSGYARSLMGATLTLSGGQQSTSVRNEPLWARTSRLYERIETTNSTGEDTTQKNTPREKARKISSMSLPTNICAQSTSGSQPTSSGGLSTSAIDSNRRVIGSISRAGMPSIAAEDDNHKDNRICGEAPESPRPGGMFTPSCNSKSRTCLEILSEITTEPQLRLSSSIGSQKTKSKERFGFPKPLRIKPRPKKKLLCMGNSQLYVTASLASELRRTNASATRLEYSGQPLPQATEQLDSSQKARLCAHFNIKHFSPVNDFLDTSMTQTTPRDPTKTHVTNLPRVFDTNSVDFRLNSSYPSVTNEIFTARQTFGTSAVDKQQKTPTGLLDGTQQLLKLDAVACARKGMLSSCNGNTQTSTDIGIDHEIDAILSYEVLEKSSRNKQKTKDADNKVPVGNNTLVAALNTERPRSINLISTKQSLLKTQGDSGVMNINAGKKWLHLTENLGVQKPPTSFVEVSSIPASPLRTADTSLIKTSPKQGVNASNKRLRNEVMTSRPTAVDIRNNVKSTGNTAMRQAATQWKKAKTDAAGGVLDTILLAPKFLRPLLRCDAVAKPYSDSLKGDMGPWSREAFDLFDWDPAQQP